MKITFIGAGNMAEALVAGIIEKGVCAPQELIVTDIAQERLKHFELMYGVGTSDNNAVAITDADVVMLAVKPQIFGSIWSDLVCLLKPGALVASIMAGVPSEKIAMGEQIKVVRVMPNTPSLIGEGAAGIAAGAYASEEDLKLVEKMMRAVGATVIVKEEEINAVTALSGSGPAYVFYLLEAMLEAAAEMGLQQDVSRELALATVIGAARLMKETGEEAAELRRKVTSKGGTTEAALTMMESLHVKASIVKALQAAHARSIELAKG
jgi:pyrroline-5-carboxylate reductase